MICQSIQSMCLLRGASVVALRVWSDTECLSYLCNAFKGLIAQRRSVQSLSLREGQRTTDSFEQRKDTAESFRVSDAFVHTVTDCQRINLPLGVKEHTLCLRR